MERPRRVRTVVENAGAELKDILYQNKIRRPEDFVDMRLIPPNYHDASTTI